MNWMLNHEFITLCLGGLLAVALVELFMTVLFWIVDRPIKPSKSKPIDYPDIGSNEHIDRQADQR